MRRQAQRHLRPSSSSAARAQQAQEHGGASLAVRTPTTLLSPAQLGVFQRTIGNAAVNTLFRQGDARIQRRESPGIPGTTTAEQTGESVPAEQAADTGPTDKPSDDGAGGGKSTTLTLNANYHEVPGKGKDRVAAREEGNALWVTPSLKSHVPPAMESTKATGVVAGVGEQTVAKMPVPVMETAPSFGRGSLTASMRFGSHLARTFTVGVDFEEYEGKGKGKHLAPKLAKEYLVEKMEDVGELGYLQEKAAEHLASKGFKNPVVTIAMSKARGATEEVGSSTFYYLARKDPTILMAIKPEPTGEKQISGSKTVEESGRVKLETQSAQKQAQKSTTVKHRERIVETVNKFVTEVLAYRKEVTKDLYKKVKDSRTSTSGEVKVKSSKEVKETTPLVRELERHEEGGKKKKKNWAAKLRDTIGKVKRVVRIPVVGKYVEKIPIIGKRIRPWHLDLAEKGADLLAVEGEVDYKDVTEKETTKGGKVTTKGGSTEVGAKKETEDRVINSAENLVEVVQEDSEKVWKSYEQKVTDIKKDYLKLEDFSSEESASRTEVEGRKATIASTSWSTTWKFSKPVVEATVVDGDGEVADAAFTAPEADAVKAAAPAGAASEVASG